LSNPSSSSPEVNADQLKSGNASYWSDGRMLVFSNLGEFEKVVDNPTNQFIENFISEVNGMSHITYSKLLSTGNREDTLMDEYLAFILNKDLTVQIGDYLYRVNKAREKVFVLPASDIGNYNDLVSENLTNPNLLDFSTEDDVFELMGQSKDVSGEKAMSKNCQSSKDDKEEEEYADFDDDLPIYNHQGRHYKFHYKLKVRYDNWGIYRKLFTEFKHWESIWGIYDETYFTVDYYYTYLVKNGNAGQMFYQPSAQYNYWQNLNNTSTGIYQFLHKNKEIIHYRSTRCLSKYYLKAWAWFRNRETLKPKWIPQGGGNDEIVIISN